MEHTQPIFRKIKPKNHPGEVVPIMCVICNRKRNLTSFRGKYICPECKRTISSFASSSSE